MAAAAASQLPYGGAMCDYDAALLPLAAAAAADTGSGVGSGPQPYRLQYMLREAARGGDGVSGGSNAIS